MKPVKCTVKYFCFGAFMIFLGSVLLCALGITVVLPYYKTKNWIPVTCAVISATYNETVCSCDQHEARTDCYDIYPCIQVHVHYQYYVLVSTNKSSIYGDLSYRQMQWSNMKSNESDELYVFDQTATLYKTWSDSFYKTCSLHVCDEQQWNKKEANRFHRSWGLPGKEYKCYANPHELNTVILNKIPYSDSVHAILWPLLCLLCGVIVWGGLYVGCVVIESMDKSYTPHRTNISLL